MVNEENFWRAQLRYELVLDTLGSIVAYYSAVLAKERAKPDPDQAFIGQAETAQRRMIVMQYNLPFEEASIDEVLREYGPIAKKLVDSLPSPDSVS